MKLTRNNIFIICLLIIIITISIEPKKEKNSQKLHH